MNKETVAILFKRLFSSAVTLFLLISFLFVIIRISPGDPSQKFISAKLGTELSQKISQSYKLNEPVHQQYISFVVNVFKGDFGTSYNYRKPVLEVIWQFLSFTIVFALLAFLIQVFVSMLLAIFVVKRKNQLLDKSISNIALLVYSTPAFVLGVLLIFFFSVKINLFPASGLTSLNFDSLTLPEKLLDQLYHLILPLVTLSAAGIAMFYKYLRDSLSEVYQQTFIINLRAAGLSEKKILARHAVPNAIRPLISVAGIELGILLSGALITEVIFSLPGMGRLTIESILTRDYPLIIGCTFAAGAIMIVTNFIADVIKIKLDKRLLKGLLN